jgi:SIR2-like domain
MAMPSEGQYETMVDAIHEGELVPFLGAGANLCGRPKASAWKRGQYLPDASELSGYLAQSFHFPSTETPDLPRVSQYAALVSGTGPLYQTLRNILNTDYPLTRVHQFLAMLPSVLRQKGYPSLQLIVTTNYDDLLERAFAIAGESFDLVIYETEGSNTGKFWHRAPGGEPRIIERPNEYKDLSLNGRTVILKIHGTVDRVDSNRDSYVITEDNYIEFLARTNISELLPITLLAKLRTSHILFLGYSLRDWNLRVILRHIWGTTKFRWISWAVQLGPHDLDTMYWNNRDVRILDMPLQEFTEELDKRVRGAANAGAQL